MSKAEGLPQKIERFNGPYEWLSNFAHSPVLMDGVIYPSVENAYQAAKFPKSERRKFETCAPNIAKRYGKAKSATPLGEKERLELMEFLSAQKYSQYRYKTLLLGTGDAELIEGNWWNDTFWGVCNGMGTNHLGKIIMKIRERLKDIKPPQKEST